MANPKCNPIRQAITATQRAIPLLQAALAKCEAGQTLEALQDSQTALTMIDCAAKSVDVAYQDQMSDALQHPSPIGGPMPPGDEGLDMGEPR